MRGGRRWLREEARLRACPGGQGRVPDTLAVTGTGPRRAQATGSGRRARGGTDASTPPCGDLSALHTLPSYPSNVKLGLNLVTVDVQEHRTPARER